MKIAFCSKESLRVLETQDVNLNVEPDNRMYSGLYRAFPTAGLVAVERTSCCIVTDNSACSTLLCSVQHHKYTFLGLTKYRNMFCILIYIYICIYMCVCVCVCVCVRESEREMKKCCFKSMSRGISYMQ